MTDTDQNAMDAMEADVEDGADSRFDDEEQLLPQLVAHLRENRAKLREEWVGRIHEAHLLEAMTQEKLDNQRDVVKNERRQSYENQPYGRAFLELSSMLYPKSHPYSWPTIGSMEDLTAASRDDVAKIESALTAIPQVQRIIHMKTLHLGPDELLVAAKIAVSGGATGTEVAQTIDDCEMRIREAVPIARVIYLEPDIRRGPANTSGAGATPRV